MKLSIGRRIIFSFLLLTTASLSFLGVYLLDFFYQKNLATATAHLVTNARIIETTLENSLYDREKQQQVNDAIQKITESCELRVTILDGSGNVLADSWERADALDNHLDRQEVQGALSGNCATAIRYSGTVSQNMLYAALPVYQKERLVGIIRTATPLTPIETNYQTTRFFILSAICTTMLLTILVGLYLAHRHTRPIEEMTRTAKRIADGALHMRIHIHTRDEFEVLAHTINQLTSNLEDKIIESNAEAKKSALILENMDNAVLLLDCYGNISSANHSAKEIFQLTPDLMGRHSISVIGASTLSETAQEVLATKCSRSVNLRIRLQHTLKTFEVFFAPILQPDGTVDHVLSVFHDISALQEIYDRQVEFVTNASHELATPLTSIKGFSETLLDGALDNPELCRKFLTIIHAESERMARLVKDLLQLAKLDNKEYCRQIKLEQVDLKEICAAVRSKLAPALAQKNLTLRIALADETAPLRANRDWIMQLMMNLVENAVKYTPPEGSIELKTWQDAEFAFVSVKDSGIGIAPQDLPFIFERFYRTDKARSRAVGGSGIGLSLVRFIVEMFGGSITAQSQPNQGTTFTFSLPLHDAAKTDTPVPKNMH